MNTVQKQQSIVANASLASAASSALVTGFRWRTKGGRSYLAPSEMKTTHLFHTLRMIWNNHMPVPVNSDPIFYNFGSFYTRRYFRLAVFALSIELSKRTDLPKPMQKQLQWMAGYLDQQQIAFDISKQPNKDTPC